MTTDWTQRSACGMTDQPVKETLALFFPEEHEYGKIARAKAICAGCPVREECLADALGWPADMDGGIRGGFTEWERADMDRINPVDLTPDRPPHGSVAGYIWEQRNLDTTCQECRDALARYQQARTSQPFPHDDARHGSPRGYRLGCRDDLCPSRPSCRDAEKEYRDERRDTRIDVDVYIPT